MEPKDALADAFSEASSTEAAAFLSMFSFSSLLFFAAVEGHVSAYLSHSSVDGMSEPFLEAGLFSVGPRFDTATLVLSSLFVGSYLVVAAMRVQLLGYDWSSKDTYTEGIERPTAHMFLGTLVFAPTFLGSLFLPAGIYFYLNGSFSGSLLALVSLGVFPAASVAVSFAFYVPYTAVMGNHFVEAFVNSWELSSGNRLALSFLFISLVGVFVVVALSFVSAYVALWGVSTALAQLVLSVGYAAVLVFAVYLVAAVFRYYNADRDRRQDFLPVGDEMEERLG